MACTGMCYHRRDMINNGTALSCCHKLSIVRVVYEDFFTVRGDYNSRAVIQHSNHVSGFIKVVYIMRKNAPLVSTSLILLKMLLHILLQMSSASPSFHGLCFQSFEKFFIVFYPPFSPSSIACCFLPLMKKNRVPCTNNLINIG